MTAQRTGGIPLPCRRRMLAVLLVAVGASCGAPSDQRPSLAAQDATADEATTASVASTTTTAPSTTSTSAPPSPDEVPLPSDAEALGNNLLEAETAVRNTALDRAERAAWGRRQQDLYGLWSFNPDWETQVLATVTASAPRPVIEEAIAQNWLARKHLSVLVNNHRIADDLPAWRIRDPLPAEQLLVYYREAEAATGIDWTYVAAINIVETRVGRISGVSTAGAVGPMQFLPTTWAECCEGDPTVDRDAIIGAATYLTDRGGPDQMDKAIFGYNNSTDYVEAVKAYAAVLAADSAAFAGYHAWGVNFKTTAGVIQLPDDYETEVPIPAVDWLAEHPNSLFPPVDPAG